MADTKGKLIPDYELLGRDDSGGPEFEKHAAEFGDAGYTTGAKSHLSLSGGTAPKMKGDERDSSMRSKK